MDIRHISERLSVGPQIEAEDLATLRGKGFRSVICNRPDGECAGQPDFGDIAEAAKELGLSARHIPVSGGLFRDQDVEAFRAAIDELPAPAFAYCRSGTRSATLWSLAEAGRLPLAEILQAARAAGYDMSGVARRIANGGRPVEEAEDAALDALSAPDRAGPAQ